MAAGITFCIVAGLTVYATQTKYDFTTAGGILTGALVALILVSVVGMFWHVKALELVIAGGGALLFRYAAVAVFFQRTCCCYWMLALRCDS